MTHKNNSFISIVTHYAMYNYIMGPYNNRKILSYNLKSLPPTISPILQPMLNRQSSLLPTISPILKPMLTRQSSDVLPTIKLPNINIVDKRQPMIDCCDSCAIHRSRGCVNNIKKNGNKIWYVLHNLVESIKHPKMTIEEFEIMCTTIVTIIRSVPCRECAGHSLLWYKSVVKNNTKLHTRIHLIYEVWKHHDDVTKRLLMMNPCIIIKRLTWNEYKKQLEIDKITCSHFY